MGSDQSGVLALEGGLDGDATEEERRVFGAAVGAGVSACWSGIGGGEKLGWSIGAGVSFLSPNGVNGTTRDWRGNWSGAVGVFGCFHWRGAGAGCSGPRPLQLFPCSEDKLVVDDITCDVMGTL